MEGAQAEVRWEWMFPDQIEAAFARMPLLYLPYGMCEPHGPQNVLGLDALKAHAICRRAAEAAGGIVAPPDYWHVHEIGLYAVWAHREIGEVARAWLTAMPPWMHFKNVCYHIRAADRLGFKGIILLTGHYGPNWEDLKTLVDLIQPHVAARLFGLPDFEANHVGFDRDGQSGGDHAGKVETSLLWSLEPKGVDYSRLNPAAGEPRFAMGPDAALADRRTGERMVEDEVAFLTRKGAQLIAAYDPGVPSAEERLMTFDDVERFWERKILPKLAAFKSMAGYHMTDPEVAAIPSHSVWKQQSTGPLPPQMSKKLATKEGTQ